MALIRCQQGHFFDPSRHPACPYCGSAAVAGGSEAPEATGPGPGATRPMRETPPPVIGPTVPIRAAGAPPVAPKKDEGRTVAVDMKKIGIDPVVGWFVCIKGKERGRDYRIRSGRNAIGRSEAMDVQISGDDTISRENHAFIVYEPRKKTFSIRAGDSRGLVYLNEEEVIQASEINTYDIVELGETQLMFIAFCGEKFHWDAEKDKPADK